VFHLRALLRDFVDIQLRRVGAFDNGFCRLRRNDVKFAFRLRQRNLDLHLLPQSVLLRPDVAHFWCTKIVAN